MEKEELPLGFTFAMAANERAMSRFAELNEEERERVVEEARNVNSKAEMKRLVRKLGEMDSFQ